MIAKGNLHAHGLKLAAYMTTGKDGERAELAELRGVVADNIRDAFTDVQIQAEATECIKPFFHAYVRLPAHEALTAGQWLTVADRMERRLGFTGQARAVAFHRQPGGGTHMHVAWSRIDLETLRAIDPGLYKNKLKELCRELEAEFGLTRVRNERAPDRETRAAGRKEYEQSRRLNTDLKAIRETIRACWDRSDSGRAFAAALKEEGLILCRGDRRDYVVVDGKGGCHALGKRITDATAAETRARLADVGRGKLPSVAEASPARKATPSRQAGRRNSNTAAAVRGHAVNIPGGGIQAPHAIRAGVRMTGAASRVSPEPRTRTGPATGGTAALRGSAARHRVSPLAGSVHSWPRQMHGQPPAGAVPSFRIAVTPRPALQSTGPPAYAWIAMAGRDRPNAGDVFRPARSIAPETISPHGSIHEAPDELSGMLESIAEEVQRNASLAQDAILDEYAAQIAEVCRRVPHRERGGILRAIRERRRAVLAVVAQRAKAEIRGRQQAFLASRPGRPARDQPVHDPPAP